MSRLLLHYDTILKYIQDGQNIDVTYLDLDKAFDKAEHEILLHKRRGLGIKGPLNRWIQEYQTVSVCGAFTLHTPTSHGPHYEREVLQLFVSTAKQTILSYIFMESWSKYVLLRERERERERGFDPHSMYSAPDDKNNHLYNIIPLLRLI